MRRFCFIGIWLGVAFFLAASAPPLPDDPLYYTIEREVTVYHRPNTARPYLTLGFRAPVHVLEKRGDWYRIRTDGGATGYVRAATLSNIWLRVSKQERAVYLYAGTELLGEIPADFGYNVFADKARRGSMLRRDHWRTPEGTFYVVAKNPNSRFYKALVLNYPTREDAVRGYRRGLITRAERDAIIEAQERSVMPPMDTALGGWIEIHGDGTGESRNWTHGCVAVANLHMNVLWQWVQVGTPVLIED